MNNRFKFRVWLKYAKLYYGLDSFYYDRLRNKYTFHFEDGHTKTIKENDCVIEQCTGLKDKNGRLIYEGDIVKVFGFKDWYILVCRFRDSSFCIDHVDGRPYNFVHSVAPVEVIGNIHENPELLEE